MTIRKELLDELLKASEGQDLFGPDGLLNELTGRLVEQALEAELTEHLGYKKYSPAARQHANSRNGHTPKTLRGKTGTVQVKVPRDREGSFEPQLVPKHTRSLPGFDERVIALYGRGLSTREITEHLEELYHTRVSRELISRITEAVMEDAELWQNRPLEQVYPLLYLDALFVKMRTPSGVRKRAVYVALGVNLEGHKEVLGLWMADEEKASFWLGVLTELKNRGLKDVFICCVDGLAGFEEAIEVALPKTIVQQCIVHLVRRSTRYVASTDRKAVCQDLRRVYQAPTAEAARRALEEASAKWAKYPHLDSPLAGSLGPGHPVLRLPGAHPAHHLHHQRHRGREPLAASRCEDAGCLPEREGGAEGTLSGPGTKECELEEAMRQPLARDRRTPAAVV